jgi:hypothetical protein
MTPNIAVGMANEMFDLDIPMIEQEWGNWPFEMVKALGAAGRLKGMEAFVEKLDTGLDPATGQPKAKPAAGAGKEPTSFGGKKGKGGKKPAATKEDAQRAVRAELLALRNILAHPEEPVTEITQDDGEVVEVRHRAR